KVTEGPVTYHLRIPNAFPTSSVTVLLAGQTPLRQDIHGWCMDCEILGALNPETATRHAYQVVVENAAQMYDTLLKLYPAARATSERKARHVREHLLRHANYLIEGATTVEACRQKLGDAWWTARLF